MQRGHSRASDQESLSLSKLCWDISDFKQVYSDEGLLFDAGASVEPNSVAYNAIFARDGGIRPRHTAVVFGCGPIGLNGIAQLKTAAASKVIVFEPSENRRQLALEMGADKVFDPVEIENQGEKASDVIKDETKGQGANFFLESSGTTARTMPVMLDSLNLADSKIVLVAWPPKPVPTDFKKMFPRGAQVICAMGHSGNGTFDNVIRLITARMLKPEKIISRRFPLRQGLEAFEVAKKREDAKVIIRPQE